MDKSTLGQTIMTSQEMEYKLQDIDSAYHLGMISFKESLDLRSKLYATFQQKFKHKIGDLSP